VYYQYPQRRKFDFKKKPRKRNFISKQREINPDTGKQFRDSRSQIVGGRVICKGADMEDLRRRVGERERVRECRNRK
jgi:hypothetical protein